MAVEQRDEAIPTEPVLLAYVARAVFCSAPISLSFLFSLSCLGLRVEMAVLNTGGLGAGLHLFPEDVGKGLFPALLMLAVLQ